MCIDLEQIFGELWFCSWTTSTRHGVPIALGRDILAKAPIEVTAVNHSRNFPARHSLSSPEQIVSVYARLVSMISSSGWELH